MPVNQSVDGSEGLGDFLRFNISRGPIFVNLGADPDAVEVVGGVPQVRITFTSSEVGNGNPNDSNSMVNQDGGLAVRVQAENGSDALVGPISRFDDEGISFLSGGAFTFDVRDLVTGAQRGDQFQVVRLGTSAADLFNEGASNAATYINAGMGDDRVTGGAGNDFLVGGAGDDVLRGQAGNDSFIGGGGDDTISGGNGDDRAIFDVSTGGADMVNLGAGDDTVNVSATNPATTQIRLTFTSSEVGNGAARDSNSMMNQDGGLAVRFQAEDGSDALVGPVSRFDDEGISFVSTGAFTFDVRDLVTGAQRGDQFDVVTLGTRGDDVFSEAGEDEAYYINAGMGDDRIGGGLGDDFLVGGAGKDILNGREGDDSFIGGGGNDIVTGGVGDDLAIFDVTTGGADMTNLGDGDDTVNVTAAAGTTQVRLTFTSGEVGNGQVRDSNSLANQDGGLAVRLQAEDGSGNLTGPVSRFDDEGITFVAAAPGLTFEVRDLVSGVSRGDQFQVAELGTSGADTFDESGEDEVYYINAGGGNDSLTGGLAADFLVGGLGDDDLDGSEANDSLLGGMGADDFIFTGDPSDDRILDFVSGVDEIDLSAFDIQFDDVQISASGADALVNVDSDEDGDFDFLITLVNAGAPTQDDFIF